MAYKVELNDGSYLEVPRARARDDSERIKINGLKAVLLRIKRTKKYKALAQSGLSIVAIVRGNGQRITDFDDEEINHVV